jgi:NAD(P)-dependent dehydrogenase (short-subunit alcohol dehydrogenase family)
MLAKAGAPHLVRQAALELAEFNILVNAIAPGPFATNIGGSHLRQPEVARAFGRTVPLHLIASN